MNATWHSATKTTSYEPAFGRKFNWRNHFDHHQRIAYTPEDGATPLGEIDEQRYHTSLAAENLQPPSCEFTFCAPDQIGSTVLGPQPLAPTRGPRLCAYLLQVLASPRTPPVMALVVRNNLGKSFDVYMAC